MAATKLLSHTNHNPGWKLEIDHEESGHWKVVSPFGSVESVVVVDDEGVPIFDRPVYREAANANLVAFGRTDDGEVRIAILRQPRHHSDLPGEENRGVDGHKPVVFGQCPMGFIGKIFGVEMADGETIDQAVARQTAEETGAQVVKRIIRPHQPWHNPNPTFVSTWSDLAFVEVDLKVIEGIKHDRSEPIFSAEFVSAEELLKRIWIGKDEQGALYRMCTANSTWMIFFATFPQYWPK